MGVFTETYVEIFAPVTKALDELFYIHYYALIFQE